MKHMIQHLRCYVELFKRASQTENRSTYKMKSVRPSSLKSPRDLAMAAIERPYGGFCMPLDWETTEGGAGKLQEPRFGIYQVYGLSERERKERFNKGTLTREAMDLMREEGIVYMETLTKHEIEVIKKYARDNRMKVMPLSEFIGNVFYKWNYKYKALLIGHNLKFDLSMMAQAWRTHDRGDYAGGFRLDMCKCDPERGYDHCFNHPPILVKHLGKGKQFMSFKTRSFPIKTGERKTWNYKGRFLDTMTLGQALVGDGPLGLRKLGERAGVDVEHLKEEWPGEHGGPITPEYLDYCRNDVDATWFLYKALRDLYRQHDVSRPMWELYSPASLTKAYMDDIGYPRSRVLYKDFPKEVIGHAMNAFYGGRTEIGYRLSPTEVITCDFTSEYPTVIALMGLDDLMLAERLEARSCLEDVKLMLAEFDMDSLQKAEMWRLLRVLVKVEPHDNLLPIRSNFGDAQVATNIALAYVTGPPTWYCLADVLDCYILTGRLPRIIDAIEIVPHGRVEVKRKAVFANHDSPLDANVDSLGVAIILARKRIQAVRDKEPKGTPRWHLLDSLQLGLKLIANSLYGITAEMNRSERTHHAKGIDIDGGNGRERGYTHVVETPGPFFQAPVAAFITAGGRLLIGLAQRLAADRNMGYAHCDTDALSFRRPDGMERSAFEQHVNEVCEWFTPLSPYGDGKSILRIEDVNYDESGRMVPLYALAISPKRYCLYNKGDDGSIHIRKPNSHGIGMWKVDDKDIPEVAADLSGVDGPKWINALWHDAITKAEQGETELYPPQQWLQVPAKLQITMSTASRFNAHKKKFRDLRPFAFVMTRPPIPMTMQRVFGRLAKEKMEFITAEMWEHAVQLERTYLYDKADEVRRWDTDEIVESGYKTRYECVGEHFCKPNSKAAVPDSIGQQYPPHVVVVEQANIGAEVGALREEQLDELDGENPEHEDAQVFSYYGLGRAIAAHGVNNIVQASRLVAEEYSRYKVIGRKTLYEIVNGRTKKISGETRKSILAGLDRCVPAQGCCADIDRSSEMGETQEWMDSFRDDCFDRLIDEGIDPITAAMIAEDAEDITLLQGEPDEPSEGDEVEDEDEVENEEVEYGLEL